MRDLTSFAGKVLEGTGIKCYLSSQIVPLSEFENMLNMLKTTLLKIFIKLDKSYGNLDSLDIYILNKALVEVEEVNSTIYQYIYMDRSLTIGDKNKITDTSITGQGVLDEDNK